MSDNKIKTMYIVEIDMDILSSIIDTVNNSKGVAGWNYNGSIAKWSEFGWVKELKEVMGDDLKID